MNRRTDRHKAYLLAQEKTFKSILIYKTYVNYWHCSICIKVFRQWHVDDTLWFDKLPKKYWDETLCRKCYKKLTTHREW